MNSIFRILVKNIGDVIRVFEFAIHTTLITLYNILQSETDSWLENAANGLMGKQVHMKKMTLVYPTSNLSPCETSDSQIW